MRDAILTEINVGVAGKHVKKSDLSHIRCMKDLQDSYKWFIEYLEWDIVQRRHKYTALGRVEQPALNGWNFSRHNVFSGQKYLITQGTKTFSSAESASGNIGALFYLDSDREAA